MMGIVNLLKPPGPTSHDVINWLRRQLGIRQIGHLGTLDPGAAGVLPICVGPATRLAEYMSDWDKKYRVEMILGVESDSQDLFGNIIRINKNPRLTEEQIQEALEQMQGRQEQVPPMFSAVKHQGRRLYDLARSGQVVTRKSRTITVQDVHILRIQSIQSCPRVVFDVTVSKGTYIRTLCADLGEKLGCGGCMGFLVRTQSGPFSLEQAWTPEEIEAAWKHRNTSFLLPAQLGLSNWPRWMIRPEALTSLTNGAPLYQEQFLAPDVRDLMLGTKGCIQLSEEELLAVGRIKEDSLGNRYCQPEKVLVGRNVKR